MSQANGPTGPNPDGYKWDAQEGGWIPEAQWNAKQMYYRDQVEKVFSRRRRNGIIACIAAIFLTLWTIPQGTDGFGWAMIVFLIGLTVVIIRRRNPYQ